MIKPLFVGYTHIRTYLEKEKEKSLSCNENINPAKEPPFPFKPSLPEKCMNVVSLESS